MDDNHFLSFNQITNKYEFQIQGWTLYCDITKLFSQELCYHKIIQPMFLSDHQGTVDVVRHNSAEPAICLLMST